MKSIIISTDIPSGTNDRGFCRHVLLGSVHQHPGDGAWTGKSFHARGAPRLTLTAEEVLTEYLNYFAAWGPEFRRAATTNIQTMRASRTVQIVSQSKTLFQAGLMLCQSRPDKGYSLVDCISMLTMREEGLTEVFTNDRHFEQEGFRALFRYSLD